jgi:GNAT superfamily N-acetyltransferase
MRSGNPAPKVWPAGHAIARRPLSLRRRCGSPADAQAARAWHRWAVNQQEQERVIATVVAAFISDPVERWLWREAWRYLTHFPAFVAAFGSAAFAADTVWALEDFAAVALWMPPGTAPDGDRIVTVLRDTVPAEQHGDVFAVLEQMDRAHPRSPHWYLPWLAVDPCRQRAGLGNRLLTRSLARVDADRLPAYLETPNPRTVALYERHGFEVVAVSQAGACPPITSMLRAAPRSL